MQKTMSANLNQKIVIKIGSQSLVNKSGNFNKKVVSNLIEQIKYLKDHGYSVILVSSGAVAMGKYLLKNLTLNQINEGIATKQLLAGTGQVKLMENYSKICAKNNLTVLQLLLTKYDFNNKKSYHNILRLLNHSIAQTNILTIINENDSVEIEELMFTDNDELSGIIAAQIGATKLILLTGVDGVFSSNPKAKNAQLISEINLDDKFNLDNFGTSTLGRGGMYSKLTTAKKMASIGITTHIANAKTPNILKSIILDHVKPGTTIVPHKKKSSIIRYIGFNSKDNSSAIVINDNLAKLLLAKKRVMSILPVGIVAIQGTFAKGDIVEIKTGAGIKLGAGIAKYNDSELISYLNQNSRPTFIHHNYLFIDYSVNLK
jgi:glutamate 5-kinase